jgi:hypothetical protein
LTFGSPVTLRGMGFILSGFYSIGANKFPAHHVGTRASPGSITARRLTSG